MSHYACWLEPAITHERVQLMQGYNPQADVGMLQEAHLAGKPPRDSAGPAADHQVLSTQAPLNCLWSHQDLSMRA
ncbi:hypothetical protein [Billgrantia aerodenitrificans]|uniref:Uncharacterized protein n=1 Tax=Billgrantia aerodenitrificans TaxID=2733483 RepID=A0ABS9AN58_9GAMM|nr:hypothetical protein [Halomonas aerodenitrificans]MCE8023161.1 hypothetical protein [Halomonas aerodenitrificans]